jgi:hypothetical protein
MLTTAGVTFFTISEKPWAIEGGTPAAVADGSPAIGLRVQARAKAHTQPANPSARPFSLHVAMSMSSDGVYILNRMRMNSLFYTIPSRAFKD